MTAPNAPDPIDLVASAIAGRLALILAADIAAALRRVVDHPNALQRRSDPTAAERQRRRRIKQLAKKGG